MTEALLPTIAASCLYTEFVGYWLHVLLHSEKIELLSRNHMIHHLVVYGPDRPQRPSREYLNSTYDRASLLGLGVEWLLPAAVLLPATVAGLTVLGVRPGLQAVFLAVSLGWAFLMFGYMHDAMHLKGFWMERSKLLGAWFFRARRRHDIHHMDLSPDGRMDRNYGICFFAFDRLFGTFAAEHQRFDRAAFEAALRRYAYIFPAKGSAKA